MNTTSLLTELQATEFQPERCIALAGLITGAATHAANALAALQAFDNPPQPTV